MSSAIDDRPDQETRGDDRLGPEPVGHPGARQRADHRAAVEHQQERQRALALNPARSISSGSHVFSE